MAEEAPKPTYTFTVYTGTRNRARTLARPYDSLRSQTFRDFEWLVVDNDSDDGTEELIAKWQAEADFPIRYIRHANRGHHGSSNVAVREARGELFVTLDSDDGAVPEALERFKAIWDEIPAGRRSPLCRCHRVWRSMRTASRRATSFPTDIFDSNATEVVRTATEVIGEKWGFQRTDVMREFPYPTVPGYTGMMSSHLVWGAIGRRYLTRFVNEYLGVVYFDQPDTMTKGVRDLTRNALGERMEAGAVIDDHLRYFQYCAAQVLPQGGEVLTQRPVGRRGVRHAAAAAPATRGEAVVARGPAPRRGRLHARALGPVSIHSRPRAPGHRPLDPHRVLYETRPQSGSKCGCRSAPDATRRC